MDGRRFDDLLRSLTDSRRSVLGGSLAAVAGMLGLTVADAKKKNKKKPCKKKCSDGCCTKKFGKCLKPAQQTEEECGTGGELCHACDGEPCGAGCDTCCANGECVDSGQISNEQCGTGGQDCFACDEEDVCDGGFCGRPLDAPCVPGDILCIPSLTCNPETLACTDCPEEDICGDTCCTGGDRCYGTVCCPLNFGCSQPNGGLGSCCAFEFCCEPDNPGPGCQCELDGCCG